MNGFIQRFGFTLLLVFLPIRNDCVAAWIITPAPQAAVSDDFDGGPGWGWIVNVNAPPYGVEHYTIFPTAYPSPSNSYLKSENGSAHLLIMDAYCSNPYACYDFGRSLKIEFDWVALESSRLTISNTYYVPVFPYTGTMNLLFATFSALPPATAEFVSTPETRHVSFTTYYEPGASDLLTLDFLAENSLGEAVPFGLDNFKLTTVPEPASSAILLLLAIAVASQRARDAVGRVA